MGHSGHSGVQSERYGSFGISTAPSLRLCDQFTGPLAQPQLSHSTFSQDRTGGWLNKNTLLLANLTHFVERNCTTKFSKRSQWTVVVVLVHNKLKSWFWFYLRSPHSCLSLSPMFCLCFSGCIFWDLTAWAAPAGLCPQPIATPTFTQSDLKTWGIDFLPNLLICQYPILVMYLINHKYSKY